MCITSVRFVCGSWLRETIRSQEAMHGKGSCGDYPRFSGLNNSGQAEASTQLLGMISSCFLPPGRELCHKVDVLWIITPTDIISHHEESVFEGLGYCVC